MGLAGCCSRPAVMCAARRQLQLIAWAMLLLRERESCGSCLVGGNADASRMGLKRDSFSKRPVSLNTRKRLRVFTVGVYSPLTIVVQCIYRRSNATYDQIIHRKQYLGGAVEKIRS